MQAYYEICSTCDLRKYSSSVEKALLVLANDVPTLESSFLKKGGREGGGGDLCTERERGRDGGRRLYSTEKVLQVGSQVLDPPPFSSSSTSRDQIS